jgi:hypothetical protein
MSTFFVALLVSACSSRSCACSRMVAGSALSSAAYLNVLPRCLVYGKGTADDFAELKRAADVLWPGAILTNSSVILGLAKLKASDVLNPDVAPKKSKPRS